MGMIVFLIFLLMWLAMLALGIAGLVFWVFMLIDVFQRKNWLDENQKILWIVLIILLGWLGALVYYFEIYKKLGKAV